MNDESFERFFEELAEKHPSFIKGSGEEGLVKIRPAGLKRLLKATWDRAESEGYDCHARVADSLKGFSGQEGNIFSEMFGGNRFGKKQYK